ncbi:Rab family GTPase [Promethearchaeum syntrophicum]|uniref:Rab family GTPase n=1 Tax=Promethearchaeum syntrophicum TaxID=2594042 RepID=A0A5B9DET4_9ARCH|nr:Rab family GTPase [Candidatus Prometheoarchaeum syntrophicum]QEE17236.1 GTPase Der [Candidatus Prometheoarchaeum syntrophicum]
MNDTQIDFIFKITVIGDSGVGKTSLIKQYTQSSFENDYISTIGAQFSIYNEEIDGGKFKLFLWDIAGEKDFKFLRAQFYTKSKAAIIVYSLEENDHGRKSFKHIIEWYKDIKEYCGEIPVIIFANKVDLIDERNFDDTEVQKLVKENNFLGIYYTSAKTGKKVTEAFQYIIKFLYNQAKNKIY